MRPDAVMLFAAGFGTRMGALTAERPKPLLEVAGRPLIDHALAVADGAGIARKVVNTHYLPEMLASHLARRHDVVLSHEPEILETGGGLRQALPLLGSDPVLTLNTDAVWSGANPLAELGQGWREDMDALLLLLPAAKGSRSDFLMDDEGRLRRAGAEEGFIYLGAQILRTSGLTEIAERKFSLNLLWDRMIAGGRAFGLIHRGGWCDVGRPEGIAEAEALLAHV